MSVLERGGNAFDAACAAGFVLQVVEPHLNGPGGDVPAIVYSAAARRGAGRVRAGPRSRRGDDRRLRRARARARAGHRPARGGRAGGVRRLGADAARLGTWELADVMAPAIAYARDGYPVVPGIVAAIRGVEDATAHRVEGLGRGLPAGAARRGSCSATCALADAYGRIARSRGRVARGAHRRRARRVLPRLGGRGGRPLLRRRGRAADAATTWRAGRRRPRRRSRSTTAATRSARPARGGRAR